MAGWDKNDLPLSGRTIIDLGHQVRDLKLKLAEHDRLKNELLHMNQGLLSAALDTIEKLQEKIQGLEATISALALTFAEPVTPYEVTPMQGLEEHEASLPPFEEEFS
jgi:DNA repair exonuclease SbcCD ATPase subunit